MRVRCLAAIVLALGCTEPVEVGFNGAGGASGSAGAAGSSGASASAGASGGGGASAGRGGAGAGASACAPVDCRGKNYQCGDCDDNDADGLFDAADPDCLGPCDDSEATFGRDAAGATTGCRQDCYFDRNSGVGNDCTWSHVCDPLSVAPDFSPSGDPECAYMPNMTVMGGNSCTALREDMSLACLENCLPLAPNGCDCFGCCELPAGSGAFVWLGSNAGGRATCTLSSADDPEACRPCTPVPSCMNECDTCEICVGKPRPDSSCGVGGEAPCAGGLPRCDAAAACGAGSYCITGCCVPAPR